MAVHTVGEESFAAYVAVRWSMLYRLATLLAGPERADQLTRTALVRAHLSWPEIRGSASPDLEVKRRLADVAARSSPPGPRVVEADEAPAPPPGERLWAEISTLLPRQRAMLVLRHHEGFSDDEIADTLGCSRSTVAAELLAIETGIDPTDLDSLLDARSEQVSVPDPPVAALIHLARDARRRRRNRWRAWAAGVVAVVVAGLVLANLVDAATRPEAARPAAAGAAAGFLSGLPTGAPPLIAYAAGRSLHLGSGRTVTLTGSPAEIVQTRKWLFVVLLSGRIVRVDTTTGEVRPVATSSGGSLVTDPSGEHLAWLAAGHGRAVVVVRTVWDWAVPLSDEQVFPVRPRCCTNPFVVDGLTEDGQVVASLPAANRTWVWHTPDGGSSGPVREVAGLGDGLVTQVVPAGVVVRQEPLEYVVGRIDDARFVRTAALVARDADFSDPHGHRVVYVDDDGDVRVREIRYRGRSRRGAQEVRLSLPTIPAGFGRVRWEDGAHVLLDVADASFPDGVLVRCAVGSGRCEIAVRFAGRHVLAD